MTQQDSKEASTQIPSKIHSKPALLQSGPVNGLMMDFPLTLAAIFRQLTDWQQPESEDHPFRGMRLRARRA